MSQALVWFVDKNPRSRKPVQYRKLEDLASEANGGGQTTSDDLLPILLPCALCCAQQQISASNVAHQLQKNRKRPQEHQRSRDLTSMASKEVVREKEEGSDNDYNQFLQLCKHVECMMEKSMEKIQKSPENQDKVNQFQKYAFKMIF